MASFDQAPRELEELVQALADGFGSLLEEVKSLSQREQDLNHRLSVLSEEVGFQLHSIEPPPCRKRKFSSRLEQIAMTV